jgi:hypothetical protein
MVLDLDLVLLSVIVQMLSLESLAIRLQKLVGIWHSHRLLGIEKYLVGSIFFCLAIAFNYEMLRRLGRGGLIYRCFLLWHGVHNIWQLEVLWTRTKLIIVKCFDRFCVSCIHSNANAVVRMYLFRSIFEVAI